VEETIVEKVNQLVKRSEPLMQAGPFRGTASAAVVKAAPLAHTAQIFPLDPNGKISGDAAAQIERTLDNLDAALQAGGSKLANAVKINVYVARSGMAELLGAAFEKRFGGSAAKPAASVVMGGLAHPDALVAMDAVATATRAAERNPRVAVLPAGPRVYISGQASPGDVRKATIDTLESLKRTLTFLGLGLSDVVQAKAFLQPISAAAEVEKEMQAFFGPNPPPIVLLEWRSKIPIEIELIAKSPASKGAPVEYLTPPGEKRARVYTRVARVHHPETVYVSGLYGRTGGDARAQIVDIFESLKGIAGQTGSDLRHLVKATYYVTDDPSSQLLNDLRPDYYEDGRAPAASKAMVPGTGLADRTITMDMIAIPAN
jgi:enamine deaminase RidA (YjgF/YER057c/UK114 family)